MTDELPKVEMAEDLEPESQQFDVFNLEDTSIETVYSNTTHAVIGEGDISLYFGFQHIARNDVPAASVKRVVLTHESFMLMMEYWLKRYNFLQTLYGGKPKTLRDLDQDAIAAAFDVMHEKPGKEAEQNEPNNETEGTTQLPSPANEQ